MVMRKPPTVSNVRRHTTHKRVRRETLRWAANDLAAGKPSKLPPQLLPCSSAPSKVAKPKQVEKKSCSNETKPNEDKVLAIKRSCRTVVSTGSTDFCWVPKKLVVELGLPIDASQMLPAKQAPQTSELKPLPIPWNREVLSTTQAANWDSPAHEGAKTLEDLLQELRSGRSSLGMGRTAIGMKLVKIEVVIVVRLESQNGRILLHTRHGEEALQRLPRFPKNRHEMLMEASQRIMNVELALPPCYEIEDLYRADTVENSIEPDYPQFGMQRRQFVLKARISNNTDPQVLKLIGLGDENASSFETGCDTFRWVDGTSWALLHPPCESRGSELKSVSPWNAQSVQQYCMENCDVDRAVAANLRNSQMVQDLVDGKCVFMSCLNDGHSAIFPVIRTVAIQLCHSGEIVEGAGQASMDDKENFLVGFSRCGETYEAHLPGCKVRDDETEMEAVEEVLEELRVPMNALNQTGMEVLKPEIAVSTEYCGLPILRYQKLLVFKVVKEVHQV